MFKLYQSNNIKILKYIMFNIIKKKTIKKNIFLKNIILISNNNISFILKMFLAKKFGICANFNFLLPAKFIWKVYKIIIPEIPEIYYFNKDNLIWVIFKLLPKLINLNEFVLIKKYLYKDYNYENLFTLSCKIADIYDEYLMYRVDWLKKWEKNEIVYEIKDNFNQKWQLILWKEIIKYFINKYNCKWNKSKIYYEFLKKINFRFSYLNNLIYKNLFIFNIYCIPPIYFNTIYVLSKYINVYYFLLNPSYEYWYDQIYFNKYNNINFYNKSILKNTNKILLNLGKYFSEYLYLLINYNFIEFNYFFKYKNNNILNRLKNSILKFNDFDLLKYKNIDNSIIIKNYCSYFEEVKELKKFLLDLILNKFYKINDIIVVVSNLDLYFPYIDSIFSDCKNNEYLPYNIMKYNNLYDIEIFNIFLNFLNIYNFEFNFIKIFDFLKKKVIYKKFKISNEELDIIWNIIKDIGVNYDFNNYLNDYCLKKINYYSLINGIKRILLGYCIDKDFCCWNNIVPYKIISNNFFYNLVEKFIKFLSKILLWKDVLIKKYYISDWIIICKKFISDFFYKDIIKKCIYLNYKSWNNLLFSYNFCVSNIKFNIVFLKKILLKFLFCKKKYKKYSINHINFCSFMSLRSMSFKVICLIGINEGVYPRNIFIDDINLINHNNRICDRNKIYDDKYSFLEYLISAKELLYISYINFSFIKNIIYYPSILLKNLFYYLKNKKSKKNKNILFKNKEKKIILTKIINFKNNKFCFFLKKNNYLSYYKEKILISLNIFEEFWKNPIKYFLNNFLNIKYFINNNFLYNEELFTSNIQKIYLLRFKIINFIIKNKNIKNIYIYLKKINLFPIGNFGKFYWNIEKKKILNFAKNIKYKILNLEKNKIIYVFNKFIIYGKLNIYNNSNLLYWLPKNINIMDVFMLWIKHLIWCYFNKPNYSYLYGYNGLWLIKPIEKNLSKIYLSKYIYGYINNFMNPIFFLPKCNNIWFFYKYLFINNKIKKINLNFYKNKLSNFFYGNNYYIGEINDLYINYFIKNFYRNIDLNFVIKNIEKWLLPLFENLIIKKNI